MYAALTLNKFCGDSLKYNIGIGNFFEPVNEGAILVGPFKSELSTMGKAMEFFKDHHDNTAVQVQSSASQLHVAATVNDKNGRLVITLVNTSGKDSIRVELKFVGGTCHRLSCDMLYAPDIDIGTTFSVRKWGFKKSKTGIFINIPKYSVVKMRADI